MPKRCLCGTRGPSCGCSARGREQQTQRPRIGEAMGRLSLGQGGDPMNGSPKGQQRDQPRFKCHGESEVDHQRDSSGEGMFPLDGQRMKRGKISRRSRLDAALPSATPRAELNAQFSNVPPQKRYEWPNKHGLKFEDKFKPTHADREVYRVALDTRDSDNQVVKNAPSLVETKESAKYEACLELILMIGFKDEREIRDVEELKWDICFNYNQALGSHHPAIDLYMVSEPDGRWHLVKTKGEFGTPPSKSRSEGAKSILAAVQFLINNYNLSGSPPAKVRGEEQCGTNVRVFKDSAWNEEERKRLGQAILKFESVLNKMTPTQGFRSNYKDNHHFRVKNHIISSTSAIARLELAFKCGAEMQWNDKYAYIAMFMSPDLNRRFDLYVWDLAQSFPLPVAYHGLPRLAVGPNDSVAGPYAGEGPRDEEPVASPSQLVEWCNILHTFIVAALEMPGPHVLARLPNGMEGFRRFSSTGKRMG